MADYKKKFVVPIQLIDHSPEEKESEGTSAQEQDVADEKEELLAPEEGSKWFDIFAGILVSTVPMVLGGYVLHVLTRSEED